VGHFVPLPFQQMFAAEVPVIGKVDPTKAVTAGGRVVQTTPGSGNEGLQQTLDAIKAGYGTSTSIAESEGAATPRKAGKSRKKA
jgi:hypothetical protein